MNNLAAVSAILIEVDLPVSMRDGVRLATDIYRPAGETPSPVLAGAHAVRQAAGPRGGRCPVRHHAGGARRLWVVVQDVRGRYASEGPFHPHFQEADNGIDPRA